VLVPDICLSSQRFEVIAILSVGASPHLHETIVKQVSHFDRVTILSYVTLDINAWASCEFHHDVGKVCLTLVEVFGIFRAWFVIGLWFSPAESLAAMGAPADWEMSVESGETSGTGSKLTISSSNSTNATVTAVWSAQSTDANMAGPL
jgi:hypothetical protein